MISFLRGNFVEKTENTLILDVHDVGYEVYVPERILKTEFTPGEEIQVFTYLQHKEDEMNLFGFSVPEELSLFKKLITVSGIGPKGALSILSFLTPSELCDAISGGDGALISKAPGIGKKTAEKVIIELRDKITAPEYAEIIGKSASEDPEEISLRNEVLEALQALGFSAREASNAVKSVSLSGKDLETVLKEALQNLGRV